MYLHKIKFFQARTSKKMSSFSNSCFDRRWVTRVLKWEKTWAKSSSSFFLQDPPLQVQHQVPGAGQWPAVPPCAVTRDAFVADGHPAGPPGRAVAHPTF